MSTITSTDDLAREFARPEVTELVADYLKQHPDGLGSTAADRFPTHGDRDQSAESPSSSNDATAEPNNANSIIESIGRDFVRLRQDGRSQAWAELEDRLMTHAHKLIAAGLMSPKDWIGLAIDIEQFRKQETGTQQAPGDFLEQWLSTPGEFSPAMEPKSTPKLKLRHAKSAAKRAKDTPTRTRAKGAPTT